MRKSALSPEEIAVCKRLKVMRDKLGLTQEEVARRVGIERGTLANYEYERTPLRCDVGLKICRQLIVSEEWLATGDYHHCKKATKEALPTIDKFDDLEDIFFRRAYDLLSEPIYLSVNPTISLYQAWKNTLNSEYERLSKQFIYSARIIFRDDDSRLLMADVLNVAVVEKLKLLHNEALLVGCNSGLVKREFIKCLYQVQDALFKRFLGYPTPLIDSIDMKWLKELASNSDKALGSLMNFIVSNGIDKNHSSAIVDHMMKRRWKEIQERLKKASDFYGGQSGLAKKLNVSRQSMSQWINGQSIPSAENVLLIMDFLDQYEKQGAKT
ncbi:helix-turn-helix domain-containing protein [Oscillatoria laete-virens NRMC-F 0139]|nr:helix-turn-helix domain-containing protein [Oscillatoria laete-virens]MDL5055346.1 helix-turn-helix domain-containing protein [Oscillatoria laete-virens NRMC-F 0139]